MQPDHAPSELPQIDPPEPLGIAAKIAIVVVALMLVGAVRTAFGCGQGADAEWTGSGRVCDFDANCYTTFECRSNGDEIEIYLPYGSISSGNEGWEWQEDAGERCGDAPA